MNEYQITAYKDNQSVSDTTYHTSRQEALNQAHAWLRDEQNVDEVDMTVIYNYKHPESELADVWWSIRLEDYATPALHKKMVITRH